MTVPEGRAGLRKAADADVHPSTPVVDTTEPSWLHGGTSTADSVGRPDNDKPVTLEVTITKSLRRAVRQEAKRRGISIDALVAEALRERTSR